MGEYQKFLKSAIQTLAEKHPEMSAKQRLEMARTEHKAQKIMK